MLYGIEGILNGKLFGNGEGGSSGGVTLPTLTNPAGADQILEGYEAVDGSGNKLTGTHVCESGGGDSSVTKGVLTILADATIDPQESVDGDFRLVVDGATVTKAVGIIAGTPISFCVWKRTNSRLYRLTNAWAPGTYDISAGEYTAIVTYTG